MTLPRCTMRASSRVPATSDMATEGVRVRRPEAADGEMLASLVNALNVELHEPTPQMTAARATADLIGEAAWLETLIAEDGRTPVGYATFHPAYESTFAARGFYVVDLFVIQPARHRGIARDLLTAVAAVAKDRGASFLWWVSKPWNVEAQAMYRDLGAIEEPVCAHALFGTAFETLAKPSRR